MSQLSDYSKFDHLDENSDTEESQDKRSQHDKSSKSSQLTRASSVVEPNGIRVQPNVASGPITGGRHTRHTSVPYRFVFSYNSVSIYEWEQSLSEVILYIPEPPAKGRIVCQIMATHLKVGLQGASQLFLDEPTLHAVHTAESTWCWEEMDEKQKVIVVYLQKAAKGVVWESPLNGRFSTSLDSVSVDQVREQLLKERWQQENPGMDFRDAAFNGSVPDPRTYMGGIAYD